MLDVQNTAVCREIRAIECTECATKVLGAPVLTPTTGPAFGIEYLRSSERVRAEASTVAGYDLESLAERNCSMARGYKILAFFALLTLIPFVALVISAMHGRWDAATTFATFFVGLIAADVVVWQGYLIKRQLAFYTYLDLDKEWSSDSMIEARQSVHEPGSDEWDHSRLETMLEFFEKLASLFKLSGDMPFIYQSTLGWYAARYFLYAYEHNQVQYLRKLWKEDNIYRDIEDFFNFYVEKEVGGNRKARQNWKERRLASEEQFWEQERRD